DLQDLAACDALLAAAPAQHMRSVLAALPHTGKPLVLCAKGIEEASGKLRHEGAGETQPGSPCAILSGPPFAGHMAGRALRPHPRAPRCRSDDIVGTQIGGAVKNVLAIACGLVEGRGLGQNARAALISR